MEVPKFVPLYLLVIEAVISNLTLKDFEALKENALAIAKQRDDIVAQMYKSLRFLATLMILIFLMEMKVVTIPTSVWSVHIRASAPTIIFGLLLIGNVVALLLSSAMMKMFMLEFILKHYASFREEGAKSFFSGLAYRFYAFTFGVVSEHGGETVPIIIRKLAHIIHIITVIMLPILYIAAYNIVLSRAIIDLYESEPSILIFEISIESWYIFILMIFNMLTSSFYIFVFFPCHKKKISADTADNIIKYRAYRLWETAECPDNRELEIWLLAEKQVRLQYSVY